MHSKPEIPGKWILNVVSSFLFFSSITPSRQLKHIEKAHDKWDGVQVIWNQCQTIEHWRIEWRFWTLTKQCYVENISKIKFSKMKSNKAHIKLAEAPTLLISTRQNYHLLPSFNPKKKQTKEHVWTLKDRKIRSRFRGSHTHFLSKHQLYLQQTKYNLLHPLFASSLRLQTTC